MKTYVVMTHVVPLAGTPKPPEGLLGAVGHSKGFREDEAIHTS